MKRVKIGLGLLIAAIGLGTSAFTVKKIHKAFTQSYYWYTLNGTIAGFLSGPSTSATREGVLHGTDSGTYTTVAGSNRTAVEKGFVDGGPTVAGSGNHVTMFELN